MSPCWLEQIIKWQVRKENDIRKFWVFLFSNKNQPLNSCDHFLLLSQLKESSREASQALVCLAVVVWIRMASICSWMWLVSHQGVALFERIKGIRRCGLVGGSVSLGVGFEVSEAPAKSDGPLALPGACQSGCRTLSYHCSTMSACTLPCFLPWWLWTTRLNS